MFSSMKLRFKWYIILRIVIVISILGTGIATLIRGMTFNFIPIIIIIAMTFLMNIIFLIILRKGKPKDHNLYVQLLFDNLLIFAIIYYTGGKDSVFSILYFINILTGAFFIMLRGGVLLAVLSTLGYSLLLLGEYFGFLVSPFDVLSAENIALENLLIRIYINALGYFLFAALGGYLSGKINIQLKHYRLRLKDIINNINSAIIVVDEDLRLDDYNEMAKNLFPNLSMDMQISEIDIPELMNIEKQKYVQFNRNGKIYDMRIQNITNRDYNSYILVINDITELKDFERKLLDKERLSAVGELSASIAHEIRNPLSSIKGSIGIISEELPDDYKGHPMFTIVLEEVERLNNLINEFLRYSRVLPVNLSDFNLNRLLLNIRSLMKIDCLDINGIDENIEIISDEDKLRQVLINIIKNAEYAVKDIDKPEIIVQYKKMNKKEMIIIRDNGVGINSKIMEKIFQPFNSSKPSGTGLGLAIVYKIIKDELNGEINVESQPGNTIFTILLESKYE